MALKCMAVVWIMFILKLIVPGVSSSVSSISSSTTATQKVLKTGVDLKLSCSSKVGSNLSWWFGGKPLYNNTIRTSKGTTLLQISNISVENQGVYWCGPSWQHGRNVTVLIGDLPSSPRKLYTTSYEFDKVLHWTSAKSTGGLPVRYTVVIHCVYPLNCSDINKGSLELPSELENCVSLKHVQGKHYSCNLIAHLFQRYKATVYTINALGNSSASITFERPSILNPSTTPGPPLDLAAREIPSGKVKLSWKNREDARGYVRITYFHIVYENEGDKKNKTAWPPYVHEDTSVIIDHLDADTWYRFYVRRQYKIKNIMASPFSSPEAISLHTRETEPDQPPQHLRCFVMNDNITNANTIQISWEPPSKQHLNGRPTTYKITYGTPSGNQSVVIVNANQTHANLTVANQDETTVVYLKICNQVGCSGISNSCQIPGLKSSPKIKQIADSGQRNRIIISVISVVLILTFIAALMYCFFCRNRKKDLPVDLPEDIEGTYDEQYHEINDGEDEAYDRPLVPVLSETRGCDTEF